MHQSKAVGVTAPPAKSLPRTIPPPPPSAPPPPSVSQASGSPGRLATKNVTIIEFPQPSRLAPLTAIDANVPAAGVLQPDGSNECNNNLTTDCLRVYNKRQYNTKFKTIDPFTFALWKLSVHLGIHMYLLTLSGSSFHVLVQQHISHAVASLSLFLSCHFAPPPQSPPAKQILAAELCCCRSLLNHRSSILNMCLLGACCYLQYLAHWTSL